MPGLAKKRCRAQLRGRCHSRTQDADAQVAAKSKLRSGGWGGFLGGFLEIFEQDQVSRRQTWDICGICLFIGDHWEEEKTRKLKSDLGNDG